MTLKLKRGTNEVVERYGALRCRDARSVCAMRRQRAARRQYAAHGHQPTERGHRVSCKFLFVALCLLASIVPALAQDTPTQNVVMPNAPASQALIRDIRIDQRLNEQVPLDLTFRDEAGQAVALRAYFDGKPVVLVLAYYDCPMLCTKVLNGLTNSLNELKFDVGKEFNVVTVSFDLREMPPLAAAKKNIYVKRYGRAGAAAGWHFLTGDEAMIKRLTDAVGFRYAYDAQANQFAHASGIMVLTPKGKLARYFYGIEYPARDLRLALVEASANKIGSPVDQLLLLCYHYDPATGKYNRAAMNLMRLGGMMTVIALVAFMFVMWRKDVRRKRRSEDERGSENVASGSIAFGVSPLFLFLLPPLFPDAASTTAGQVDALFYFMLGVCGFVALLVIALIVFFSVKYRQRSEDEVPPPPSTSHALEWTWIIIPTLIFIGMFVWGASIYFNAFRPPADALEVYVIGKQWMWKFQHPEGQREINELHVPVNRAVKLTLESQDVIHSFYVPAFRIHRDVLPGRFNTVWFEATKPGRYHLFCSQYCGTQHAEMGGYVAVMEQADYQRWLATGAQDSLASKGQSLFQKFACSSCHMGNAQARAPYLVGLYGSTVYTQSGEAFKADESYIRESILSPQAKIVAGYQNIMPTYQNQISEEELMQLIAYIKSLGRERQEEVPPVSSPQGPQPQPAGDAIKQSANGRAQR